jgi:hypothetical protein
MNEKTYICYMLSQEDILHQLKDQILNQTKYI